MVLGGDIKVSTISISIQGFYEGFFSSIIRVDVS